MWDDRLNHLKWLVILARHLNTKLECCTRRSTLLLEIAADRSETLWAA